MRERVRAWLCVAAIVLVVGLFPLVEERDSFPLSNYPMFSYRRTSTETVDTAVLVQGDHVERLSPETIAGTDEIILAATTVSQAIGRGHADELCADIAARVDSPGTIEVVTERFDSVRWYRGDRTPLARTVHAECDAESGA